MQIHFIKKQLIILSYFVILGCGNNPSSDAVLGEPTKTDEVILDTTQNSSLAEESQQILNSIRSSDMRCGFRNFSATNPLTWNTKLEQAANTHLTDMINIGFFEHTGSDGSSVGDRATSAGFDFQGIAENLASGQRTLQSAFNSWVDSPGHCENLMGSNHKEFGLATNGTLWVAVFGRSF